MQIHKGKSEFGKSISETEVRASIFFVRKDESLPLLFSFFGTALSPSTLIVPSNILFLTGTLCPIKDHLRCLHFNIVLVHSTVQTHIQTDQKSSGVNQFFFIFHHFIRKDKFVV